MGKSQYAIRPAVTIRTWTGKLVNLERPIPEQIDIRDIAHALGQLNRFTGHTARPYTVAEHCVIGSQYVPPEWGLEFLLHDAPEAYLGDMNGPLKGIVGGRYAELEANFARVIAGKFRLRSDKDGNVEGIDRLMLRCEQQTVAVPCQSGSLGVARVGSSERIVRAEETLSVAGGAPGHEERICRALRVGGDDAFLPRFRELAAERFADLMG